MTRVDAAPPRLAALATAVPPFVMPQQAVKREAALLFGGALGDVQRLLPLFDNAGIAQRYSAVPMAWHLVGHGFGQRNATFITAAEDLLIEAAKRALDEAGLPVEAVDEIVTVCSSGIATPSLDARVAERLGFRDDVLRTPLFGLGCAGGVLGLSRAAAAARAAPGNVVLLLVVELCSLTFRLADKSKANLVASALFGDGAAAAVIGTDLDGPALGASGEQRWPDTLDVMGWDVADDGLGVLFSIKVPEFARTGMRAATDRFLDRHRQTRADIDRYICHPGGAKVIDGLEEALELAPGALADSRGVLRDCGNMSAATVLFVLERALAEPGWRRGLVTALGPGFTAGFQLVLR